MTDAPFPTARQIATAVVMAARHMREDPETVLDDTRQSRARHMALDALRTAFDRAPRPRLAYLLGYPRPGHYAALISGAQRTGWWNADKVDEIVGALVAEDYGDQSA